ncbi:Maltose/maltodextrin ABC transporter, permease protein MalG (plasmid) [Sinorhizobium alkalisoli]|nr:Maltose/maltodextrin ABC transporter, permease protein MalG [Sinorhizobium alkalisoli]
MSSRTGFSTALTYVAGLLFLAVFIGPILWFVALAIRPAETAFSMPPQLAFEPSLDAFRHILVDPGTNAPQLGNSLIVASAPCS